MRSHPIRALLAVPLVVAGIAAGSAVPTFAAFDGWTSGGPFGANITALAIDPGDPGRLYAGTVTGRIFKTSNGGDNWVAADAGVRLGFYGRIGGVSAIAVDAQQPDTVYAAVAGALYKSTDAGGSWLSSFQRDRRYVAGVAVDPSDPSVIYAGGRGFVVRSDDAGATWAPTGSLPPNHGCGDPFVALIAVDPVQTNIVYAAGNTYDCSSGDLYKTLDGGDTWSHLELPGRPAALTIDPAAHERLYAAPGIAGKGVIRSVDAGQTWESIGLSTLRVTSVAVDPAASGTLYAAADDVYTTSDDGANWTATGLSGSAAQATLLVADPHTPGVVYAGTRTTAVYKTPDAGATWSPAENGITDPIVLSFIVGPADANRMIVGTDGGLWRSTDGGAAWSASAELSSIQVLALAVDPLNPDRLFAGTAVGAYRSTDGGATWEKVGLSGRYVAAIAIAPTNPIILYAGTDRGLRLRIGNDSWQRVTELPREQFLSFAVDPTSPTTVWAGADSIYKTVDSGSSWTEKRAVKPSGDYEGHLTITIDPNDPETVYVAVPNTIARTTDGGTTWSRRGFPDAYGSFLSSLTVDPSESSTLFATVTSLLMGPGLFSPLDLGSSGGEGVWVSRDGGVDWIPMQTGLRGNARDVQAFAVDPSSGTRFAGAWGGLFEFTGTDTEPPSTPAVDVSGGVFQTEDRGFTATWNATDAGSGVVRYELRERAAAFDDAKLRNAVQPFWWGRTRVHFRGSRGSTYCFSVRAADADANASAWSDPERCTAVPLDDTRLSVARGDWTHESGDRYYDGTFSLAKARGASLSMAEVQAKRLALLVERCPRCGSVDVMFAGHLLRHIRLTSDTTRTRVLVKLAAFSRVREGTVRIIVTSSRKKVVIDGLGVSKV